MIEQARRETGGREAQRLAQDRCFRFINTLAGNLPGFEEACRALYAGRAERFDACLQAWPTDLRRHATRLAQAAF